MKGETIKYRWLIFALFLLPHRGLGQQKNSPFISDSYRATSWVRSDGLTLDRKNSMLKDVNGFLWIISPVGLNRFDGSTFKIFYPEIDVPGSISGAYSFSLVEDSLHNIWVGTNKGISRYDIKADTFRNFSPAVLSTGSIATVVPFYTTRDLVFCFEAGHLLTNYNIHTFEKKLLFDLGPNHGVKNNMTVPHSIYDAFMKWTWSQADVKNCPSGIFCMRRFPGSLST